MGFARRLKRNKRHAVAARTESSSLTVREVIGKSSTQLASEVT
jgi:hypothetical protein